MALTRPVRVELKDPQWLARTTWQSVAIATAGLLPGWLLAVPMTLVSTAVLSQSAVGRPMRPGALLARQIVRWATVLLVDALSYAARRRLTG